MAIDFTLAPEHEEIRTRVRTFVDDTIKPAIEPFGHRDQMKGDSYRDYVGTLIKLRSTAKKAGLWLPHMPAEWGGMGLGHVALAMVQAEAAKTRVGPWVFNCQAPDESTCTRCCTGPLLSRKRSTSSRCAREPPRRVSR